MQFATDIEHTRMGRDTTYEFKIIRLTKDVYSRLQRLKENDANQSGGGEQNASLFSEKQMFSAGISQSRGWEHYHSLPHEKHILMLRRTLPIDKTEPSEPISKCKTPKIEAEVPKPSERTAPKQTKLFFKQLHNQEPKKPKEDTKAWVQDLRKVIAEEFGKEQGSDAGKPVRKVFGERLTFQDRSRPTAQQVKRCSLDPNPQKETQEGIHRNHKVGGRHQQRFTSVNPTALPSKQRAHETIRPTACTSIDLGMCKRS